MWERERIYRKEGDEKDAREQKGPGRRDLGEGRRVSRVGSYGREREKAAWLGPTGSCKREPGVLTGVLVVAC